MDRNVLCALHSHTVTSSSHWLRVALKVNIKLDIQIFKPKEVTMSKCTVGPWAGSWIRKQNALVEKLAKSTQSL